MGSYSINRIIAQIISNYKIYTAMNQWSIPGFPLFQASIPDFDRQIRAKILMALFMSKPKS